MTPTPKFGKTPLELLAPPDDYDKTLWEKIGLEMSGVGIGFAMQTTVNWFNKRPFRSGKLSFSVIFNWA